ncbi:hypothetical protein SCHPADRAFT_946714 [Schizopora paradoxa]|uniref:Uncharacterized protein n=1 Tax=Schizopora paradoxa TaxID=27342 RepID=A0A0H2R838_9AGAM|nr:hypothetical protein SCHPADRAFT_946714 [Schizopora paradoxa]
MADQLNMPTKNQFPSMSTDPRVPGKEDDVLRPNLSTPQTSNLSTLPGTNVATFNDSRVVDRSPFADPITAEDTMTGATSQDVHDGLGDPGSGMTSSEEKHGGAHHRKREGTGAEQFGQPSAHDLAEKKRVTGKEGEVGVKP